jgi:hypothetical protein
MYNNMETHLELQQQDNRKGLSFDNMVLLMSMGTLKYGVLFQGLINNMI